MTKCCVIGCKNVGIHKFPINLSIRRKWIAAVRIKNFMPTKTTRLCRDHFHENDYRTLSVSTGLPSAHKFLKKEAVPSLFSWNQKTISASARARDERHAKRNIQINLFQHLSSNQNLYPSTSSHPQPSTSTDPQPSTSQNPQYLMEYQRELEISSLDAPLQSTSDNNINNQNTKTSVSTQTATMLSLFSTDILLSDDESVKFYTGLENYDKFKFVLSTLLPMADHLKYRWSGVSGVSTEDQFIMMLIKLRRASPDLELSKMFGVSKTQVSNIFITWVNFVNDLWSLIDIWPQRDLVNFYMPAEYKPNKMPTRVIIDCTEIPITKPSDPKSQQITFSSYKNRNTIKFLVGSTPGGLLSYCSEGFGGSISDRQMIERSKLIKLCDEGDSIMADRGFNVQDLFAPKNIGINIPTFLRGKAQLPGLALLHDRKIASQRVHIERLIGLTKTYKILKTELNAYYVPLTSKIFFICLMLSNFRECIINKTHK